MRYDRLESERLAVVVAAYLSCGGGISASCIYDSQPAGHVEVLTLHATTSQEEAHASAQGRSCGASLDSVADVS